MILHQTNYIKTILACFNLENINSAMTPMKVGLNLIKEQAPRTPRELNEMKKILYQTVARNLMYYMVCTRPNIAFVVEMVSQFLSNLRIAHWKEDLKCIFKYLKGTIHHELKYHSTKTKEFTLMGVVILTSTISNCNHYLIF